MDQLGDIVCTTTMCTDGHSKVAEMWNTYNYLKANYPDFDAAHFDAAVNTIQQSLDAVHSWYETWIPFNSSCCTEDDIGNQAVVITNQMLQSVGAASVPPPPASTDWTSLLVIAGVITLAVVYSPQIKSAMKGR